MSDRFKFCSWSLIQRAQWKIYSMQFKIIVDKKHSKNVQFGSVSFSSLQFQLSNYLLIYNKAMINWSLVRQTWSAAWPVIWQKMVLSLSISHNTEYWSEVINKYFEILKKEIGSGLIHFVCPNTVAVTYIHILPIYFCSPRAN